MQHPSLSETLDAALFHSLSVVQVGHEWQANLLVEKGGGWRVCHGASASEAVAALFAPCPVFIPPPPY